MNGYFYFCHKDKNMTLIRSISGIRGTIGGVPDQNLTPIDVVKFSSAYGMMIKKGCMHEQPRVVIGRDARISGAMIQSLVINSLIAMGIDVISLELSTTPTVEFAVVNEKADGGIVLTASHNPAQWNALKLLNERGEFIDAVQGQELIEIAESESFEYSTYNSLGKLTQIEDYIEKHIDKILALKEVDCKSIQKAGFKFVVDGVSSTGGIAVPMLLNKLGVDVVPLYCEPSGNFPHNPEPLEEHLVDLKEQVKAHIADGGIVVDPDVDRLAFVDENGDMFGEEYTLVACADYILSMNQGATTVSNLSSTRALTDVTEKYSGQYFASAVGEVNVVEKMKEKNAIIGGEGNGGVIYPKNHYGRDALVGIALFLSSIAQKQIAMSEFRASFPSYFMSKQKIELSAELNVDLLLQKLQKKYSSEDVEILTIDGVKILFKNSWVHLRKSNTEPIIRVYTESTSFEKANDLAKRFCAELLSFV